MTNIRRSLLLIVIALLFASCASGPSFPYRACLFDRQGRYDIGKVIASRFDDDGVRALMFEFDDETKGDHGFRWVREGESRSIRRCREATLMDVDNPLRDASSAGPVTTIPEPGGAR